MAPCAQISCPAGRSGLTGRPPPSQAGPFRAILHIVSEPPEGPWWTGPSEDRFRYRVNKPEPLPGGQGFVFAAETGDGTRVALKLRDNMPTAGEEAIRARLGAVRDHPHPGLAEPIEIFRGPGLFTGPTPPATEDSDLLYVASRWVPGASLRASAPLPAGTCGRTARSLAAALTHLHDTCGLVHRDVHPGNVIIGPDADGTLIDLGAARPDDGTATVTVAGAVGFIAPERTHGPGDRRTDAWGLGMVAAFALLGHSIAGMTDDELQRELSRVLDPSADLRRVRALLAAMTAHDPAQRPSDLVGWAEELHAASLGRPRRSRRAPVAAGVAAAAVIATIVAVSAARAGNPGEEEPTPNTASASTSLTEPVEQSGCTEAIGTPEPTLAAEQAAAIAAVTAGLSDGAPEACGTGFAALFGDAVYQPVRWGAGDTARDGVVITSPFGTVLFTTAQWASYREIAGRQRPENAVTFGGYPLAFTAPPVPGETSIQLSNGGLLVGARDDSQAFWMPTPVRALWEAQGGADGDLGLPMTNPFVVPEGMRQDFERGYLELPAEITIPLAGVTPEQLVVKLEPDPVALLPDADLRGGIVRQPTGSAWWLDARGVRHWIPDGATWDCLGGADAVTADELAGAALASFPLGEPATCAMAR